MDYITAKEAAQRWGVTVRRVQQYCKEGLLPGAAKMGKAWLIPRSARLPDFREEVREEAAELPGVYQTAPFRPALPLLNGSFPPGQAMAYLLALPDRDDRNIALGEYYYFCGRAEEAVRVLEPYLESEDPSLRFSASFVYAYANLSRGQAHLSHFALHNLYTQVRAGLRSDAPPEMHAIGRLAATAAAVLLHLPLPNLPPLKEYLRYLPEGLKLFACYVLAHQAYLERDYSGALAIAEMGLALCPQNYPAAEVYVHIAAAMALMNLRELERAKAHIEAAWAIAEPDDLIQPFGEHHGLLQGLIEICFRKERPADFSRIIAITYAFSAGWRKVHNPETQHDVADNLTTTEFTIAMLYSRGWGAKEIAAHMELSERSVRSHLAVVYEKLGITSRKELGQFMLQ